MKRNHSKLCSSKAESAAPLRGAVLAFDVSARAADVASGVITGYGSVFNGPPNHNGVIIEPGAYAESLRQRMPAMLWSHNMAEPVGKWTKAEEDSYGLKLTGQLNTDVQRGQEALDLYKSGAISGLSYGGYAEEGGFRYDGNTMIISKMTLLEVSLVAIPAEERARVLSVRASIQTPKDFERWLRSAGFNRREALRVTSHGFIKGLGQDGEDTDDDSAVRLLAHVKRLTRDLRKGL